MTAQTSQNNATYYPWFDWLRFILAFTVLLSHSQVFAWHNAGHLAVQVFFALSGWLIGSILLGTDIHGIPRFYFNRATRIWIPYALALGLLLALSMFRDSISPKYLEFVLYKLTFVYDRFGTPQLGSSQYMPLHGTGNHFWSICTEEQFYLLSPLLLVFAPSELGRSKILWSILACFAVALDEFGAICLGVFAAVLSRKHGPWHQSVIAKTCLLMLMIVTTAVMRAETLRYELVSPFFAISVVLLLATEGKPSTVGRFLGGMSYPLYLNQWIGVFATHFALKQFGMRTSILATILSAATSLAFCSFLYLVVDSQVIARRATWYSRRLGWTLAGVGYVLIAIGSVTGVCLAHN